MENRGAKHRRERIADALRDEISAILEGELGDPRVGLVTISGLLLSDDGKAARVFVNVDSKEEDPEETLAGLNAAKGFIRHMLVERLGLRHAPELFFYLDHSLQQETRVDQLLQRLKKRK
jgi:ribosome-binding factor A